MATSGTGSDRGKLLPALHPVVRTHPETGRKGLFVNTQFTQSVLGLSKMESNAILELLYHHCEKPEYTCRFRWRRGSVAFWDNRATLHYALDDYGDTPASPTGSPCVGTGPSGRPCPRPEALTRAGGGGRPGRVPIAACPAGWQGSWEAGSIKEAQ